MISKGSKRFRHELNQAIDFDKVLEKIASYASFSNSKNEILNAIPYFDRLAIQRDLDYVSEGLMLLQKGESFSFAGCSDVSFHVKQATKQMTLSPVELQEIAAFLVSVKNSKEQFLHTETKLLKDLADSMDPCFDLIRKIQSQIDMNGTIKIDATDLYKRLHKQLVDTRLTLNDKARAFVKRNSSYLMETMTTTINGRLSVLVKNQDKNKFGGMMHGSSQSGQASYIEPAEFVSLNNQISQIEADIEEEKHRICRELSKSVSKKEVAILSNLETMTVLDVAITKAKWAYDYDGCVPILRLSQRNLRLENARHPLIDKEKCVPNTYVLKQEEKCLMISGPNMGGKTVTLKTIGLFVALSHAGFPVLCHHAQIPYFESLWFDIGDNQSIENNLSTFSSHISKISMICDRSNKLSFVLLDEIGNGTDPLEGSSLAIAILEHLIEKECMVITSTHYSQVKSFGKAHDHVLVSSVEFDSKTLKPTYKYVPGVSGASYAFLIAKQYHLNENVLSRADYYKSENEEDIERQLEKLEKLQNDVLRDKQRFSKMIEEAHKIQKDAQSEKRKWENKNKDLQETYDEKLREMLEEKEKEANEIIQTLKAQKSGKMHEQSEALHQIHILQSETEKEEVVEVEDKTLTVGDYVQLEGLQTHGEIVGIRKNEATVLVNGMKMKVKLNRLKRIHKPKINNVPKKVHHDRNFKRFPLELNLIGMRVDEGLDALDHYLDQAVYHKVNQVRIIHGMGTGALRNAVWKYLDKHPMVTSKMSGGPSEGGLGATIVLLK